MLWKVHASYFPRDEDFPSNSSKTFRNITWTSIPVRSDARLHGSGGSALTVKT